MPLDADDGASSVSDRPAISRRSCNFCRKRKIACDRALPCSNCRGARIDCAYSAVVPKQTSPKHRVLLSAQYEQKINTIASDLSELKTILLQGGHPGLTLPEIPSQDDLRRLTSGEGSHCDLGSNVIAHVGPVPSRDEPVVSAVEFLRQVLGYDARRGSHCFSDLEQLVDAIDQETPRDASESTEESVQGGKDVDTKSHGMPPSHVVDEAIVWARGQSLCRWFHALRQVLPFPLHEAVCRKVCFSSEASTESEYIIANSFLGYIFTNRAAIYGSPEDIRHSGQCRSNLNKALTRLPLWMPASMESVAALVLGVCHLIEEAKPALASRLMASAASMSQTLDYHRLGARARATSADQAEVKMQQRLFWAVVGLDSVFSFKMGRASLIRDSDIVLPPDPDEHYLSENARIERRAYDELFSPAAMMKSQEQKIESAWKIAEVIRRTTTNTERAMSSVESTLVHLRQDVLESLYMRCLLISQTALLAVVLKSVPQSYTPDGQDCVFVARKSLGLISDHQAAMQGVKYPLFLHKYLGWNLLHVPFEPFIILYNRAVRSLDFDDLQRLEVFAEAIQAPTEATSNLAQRYRLYTTLCRGARAYMESMKGMQMPFDPSLLADIAVHDGMSSNGQGMNTDANAAAASAGNGKQPSVELGDWEIDETILPTGSQFTNFYGNMF